MYFLAQISFFGTVLGRFSQFNFSPSANHGRKFYSVNIIKKPPTALQILCYLNFLKFLIFLFNFKVQIRKYKK